MIILLIEIRTEIAKVFLDGVEIKMVLKLELKLTVNTIGMVQLS